MKKTLEIISRTPKKKAGRRPIADELRKNKLLEVRFSAAEVANLKAKAERHGGLTKYVRERLGL